LSAFGIQLSVNGMMVCQGREVSAAQVEWLRQWIADHGHLSRHRLAHELCRVWNWTTPTGQRKHFAARSFLLKLEQRALITLPPVRVSMRRARPGAVAELPLAILPDARPITARLADLQPLQVLIVPPRSAEEYGFAHYLAQYHYLGFTGTVGENLKYLVRDRDGRDLACLLFGSAAWKTAPRDRFIGWSDPARQRNVNLLTNNTRFLLLPWVRVEHLASHILGLVVRRLSADWQAKYGHPIHLIETFVERDRFRGTCYRAANWLCVGQTRGRSRQDRDQTLRVPIKDIYVYPLTAHFREALGRVQA
jgi:hypothetical protein